MMRESLMREELLRRAVKAHALMVFAPDVIDEDFLSHCPYLRIVAGTCKDYHNIDVEACTRRGIWVTTVVPDLLSIPTAELAVGLAIGLTRNVPPADRFVRSGGFDNRHPELYGWGIAQQRVGIVGMGAVGQTLARMLQGFGPTVTYTDSHILSPVLEKRLKLTNLPITELLGTNDITIITAPYTDHPQHVIDKKMLKLMKPGAYLVNVCRRSMVDEDAIAEALSTDMLAGYAADAFEAEDIWRPGRPRAVSRALLEQTDKTLLTCYLGPAIEDIRKNIALEAAANIFEAFLGRVPKGAVNRPRPATRRLKLVRSRRRPLNG
jgi:phosphonate dehydrogenase